VAPTKTETHSVAGESSQGTALDARELTTRELNAKIRSLVSQGKTRLTILNPEARHNLAVGILQRCSLRFDGSVGYYCLSYCDGIDATVNGNSGWGLGDNLMSGKIVVTRNVGSSTGASMRGGQIIVWGNAGARTGISMKGGILVVAGNSGFLTGFMMQKGKIIVLGDVGSAAGDSMYEGVIYFGGKVQSLGADAQIEEVSPREAKDVLRVLEDAGAKRVMIPSTFRKITSKKKLYHYDSLEPLERDRLVI
jgi:methylamine---glutamate N-methyltransferase subunit B